MGKRLFFWELGGFLFTAAMGALLRALYPWAGGLSAPAAAVNGSLWEEMKTLFVPVFLFSLVQILLLAGAYPRLPEVRVLSVLFGLGLMPVVYYTYSGILGRSLPWVDGALPYLADLGMFWLDFRLLRRGRRPARWRQILGLASLWGLAFLFVWCTFRPPDLALWRDPAAPGPSPEILASDSRRP